METKDELRRKYRDARAAIERGDQEAWSLAIARRVTDWLPFQSARTVFTYEARGREVSTADIIGILLSRGAHVMVPDVAGKTATPDRFRFAGPTPRTATLRELSTVDLFLLPGIAFDEAGNRMGQGAGYFDRLLEYAPPLARVAALAFEMQLVASVPADPWDKPMQFLITERRLVTCG